MTAKAQRSLLNVAKLNQGLVRPGALWREVRVVPETGSTNADLLAEARSGAAEGLVLAAEAQTAGRGRMGRRWVSPPAAGLTFSVLLRPGGVPASALGWVPLLAGVATASALRAVATVDARLKWPNDVIAGTGKLAGILAESRGDAVVVGVGINVSQRPPDLPGSAATSLLIERSARPGQAQPAGPGGGAGSVPGPKGVAGPGDGAGGAGGGDDVPGRDQVLSAVLRELARWYAAWRDQASPGDADACGLRREYLRWCDTVGRTVTVGLPGGAAITGTAVGVDAAGRLEVETHSGRVQVSAGDVVHVR